MTDLIQCPDCGQAFLMPPEPCPACGTVTAPPMPASPRGPDRVVSSRMNQSAQMGGVLIAGILTASLSWFLYSREMGVATLLLALLIVAVMLWRRP